MRTIPRAVGVAVVAFVGTLGTLYFTTPAKPPPTFAQKAPAVPTRPAYSPMASASTAKVLASEDTLASAGSSGPTEDEGTRKMFNLIRPTVAQAFRYTTVRFSTLHVFAEKATESVIACGFFTNEFGAQHSFVLRGFTNSRSAVVRKDPSEAEMHKTRCYEDGSISYLGSDEFNQ